MFPADELHQIRCEIRLLREREARLRARMIADPGGPACSGRDWEGVVVTRESRRLDTAAIPADWLMEPSHFATRAYRSVLLRPAGHGARSPVDVF